MLKGETVQTKGEKKMSRLREKTTATLLIAIFMISAMAVVSAIGMKDYATIQDGTITDVNGNPITVGYDIWGYNYQAHMFYGFYENNLRPEIPVTEGTMLIMKWSDS